MKKLLALVFALSLLNSAWALGGKISVSDDVDLKLSGSVNLDYATIEGVILEGENALNQVTAGATKAAKNGRTVTSANSANFFTGRFRLGANLDWGDMVSVYGELESKSINDPAPGASANDWNRFGSDTGAMDLDIEQLYLDVKGAFLSQLDWRFGVQDVRYKNAVWDEPFFLDVTESESAWTGINGDATGIRNNVFRDTMEPVGFRARIMDKMSWTLDLFYYIVNEDAPGNGGNTSEDETVAGAAFSLSGLEKHLNFLDEFRVGALFVNMKGGTGFADPTGEVNAIEGMEIWTFGLTADAFVLDKQFEVLAEYYNQWGDLSDEDQIPGTVTGVANVGADKQASAWQAAVRYYADNFQKGLWGELRYVFVSGDDNNADNDDEQFQSYENVDDFLVVESNDFGLDIDQNYNAWKFKVGISDLNCFITNRPLDIELKYGIFEFNEPIWDATGQSTTVSANEILNSSNDEIGSELDIILNWTITKAASVYFQAGILSGSDALDQITPSGDSSTWATVFGTKINW